VPPASQVLINNYTHVGTQAMYNVWSSAASENTPVSEICVTFDTKLFWH
jgi:hypothetical protein